MSRMRLICLVLIVAAASCHARPNWPSGEIVSEDSSNEPLQERINLHHSLKDLRSSAVKAVKDIRGYLHQQLSSVTMKHLNTISKPLLKVLAPVALLERVIIGRRPIRPLDEEESSSPCPGCIQTELTHAPEYFSSSDGVQQGSNCATTRELTVVREHTSTANPSSAPPFLTEPPTIPAHRQNQRAGDTQSSTSETTKSPLSDIIFPDDLAINNKPIQIFDSDDLADHDTTVGGDIDTNSERSSKQISDIGNPKNFKLEVTEKYRRKALSFSGFDIFSKALENEVYSM